MTDVVYSIGVDPGLEGACVPLFNGEPQRDLVVRARSYKIKTSSVADRRLDAQALHDDLMGWEFIRSATVYIEDPNMIFKNGATRLKVQFETIGMFKFAFQMLGDPEVITVQPDKWKRKYGLISKNKRASVDRVHEIFPGFGKLLVKDADIAEAVIIGRYGWKYLNI